MQANLSALTDKKGNLKAKLEVKFCRAAAPYSLPSKSTVSSPVAEAPGQPAAGRRRKRRGPAARERARARAACYRAAKAAAAAAHGGSSSASEAIEVSSEPKQTPTPPPPPPLPPPPATARLIKVVERKASSWPTFSQLDGEGGSVIESRGEVRQVDASSTASSSPPSPHTPVKAKFCWTMSCYNPNTGSPSTCRHLFRGLPRQLHTPAGVLQE